MSSASAPLVSPASTSIHVQPNPAMPLYGLSSSPSAVTRTIDLPWRRDPDPLGHGDLAAAVAHALDQLCKAGATASPGQLTSELFELLSLLKDATGEAAWNEVVVPAARAHPIRDVIHACPFTRHAFDRPRGYPGDAGLIDFVYRHDGARPAEAAATDAGRAVMEVAVNVPGCAAVRRRRDILARAIDDVATRRKKPEILAVACGYLREAEISEAVQEGRVGRFVALDQDEHSLHIASTSTNAGATRIDARNLTVKHLLARRHLLGTFDLVYAAGLYDYLDARVAARLTSTLFNLLKPGGRVIVPNFRTGVREEGYMEIFMDWKLIYRSRSEIEAFADEIDPDLIADERYYEDETGLIGYLEVDRVTETK